MTDCRDCLKTRDGSSVFRLGYGTLTLAKSQKNLGNEEAARLFSYAYEQGINWFDTAELYDNYEQIAVFLKGLSRLPFISSKSYAYDKVSMRRSIEQARRRMGVDVIDLFMLHEQVNEKTLAGHKEAFETLLEAKEKGVIRYTGVSTHAVSVVERIGAEVAGSAPVDPDFDTSIYRHTDVLFPLLSRSGYGLLDGNSKTMEDACVVADKAGVTIFGMKLFGGGHLLTSRETEVQRALNMPFVCAWSVGMGSIPEIETNMAWFVGDDPSSDLLYRSASLSRRLQVTSDCTRCGRCVERCQSGAMSLGAYTAVCDETKCTLCSYCASVCQDMAIKVF